MQQVIVMPTKEGVFSMLAKKVAKLINDQVTLEFYSAYLYLDFANFYNDEGLDGFAHWFEIQAQEERDHAMLMRINKIYGAASDENDYRTMECFNWFVKEQGEEEKNVSDLIKKFKLFGIDPKGLYALNQELLTRVYAAPTLVL